MKLIVGLGNPGTQYENNRHNVGHMFVDYLINKLTGSPDFAKASPGKRVNELKNKKKFNSQLVNALINNKEYILVKPEIYMNLSGQAIKSLTTNYSLLTTNLIIVHDDLDVPLGKFRIDFARGPKLHNGIESIEQQLKTKDFWRVRIGVDNRQVTSQTDGETYVLQNFRPDEKKIIENLFPKIWKKVTIAIASQPSAPNRSGLGKIGT